MLESDRPSPEPVAVGAGGSEVAQVPWLVSLVATTERLGLRPHTFPVSRSGPQRWTENLHGAQLYGRDWGSEGLV